MCLSFWYKCLQASPNFTPEINDVFLGHSIDGTESTTWKKYSSAAYINNLIGIYGFIDIELWSNTDILISDIKVEKGNKATDWTPSPEDVQAAIDLKANIASPSFTGIPLAPTALVDNNSNQIATTAFVKSQNYLTSITKAQVEAVLTGNISSHTHNYLPLTGGTITGSVYNMLELKRSDANGSSILFSNSAGNLGKLGFASNGVFHLGTGTSTDGVGNLLQISTTGATTFYNSVTAPSFIGSLSGNASTATKTLATVTGTNSTELVRGNMADNDQFRILVGGTASNAGYVEIATADDGTEPIYVRQYTGVFANLVRTATLLDGSGNTSFPGSVTATSFIGNASTATALTTNAGSNTNPIYFSGGKPTASSYSFGNASGNIPISNGTLNSNLNADLLDGLNSTDFARSNTGNILFSGFIGGVTLPTPAYIYRRLGLSTDAKSSIILFARKYSGTYLNKEGFVGSIHFSRGNSGALNITNNLNVSIATAYGSTVFNIYGDYPGCKIITTTYNSVEYYGLYIPASSTKDIYLSGWLFSEPILISDASSYIITDVTSSGQNLYINNVQAATINSNVASATKLQTARTIAGVSFDGTADIAIPFVNLSSKPTTLAGYGITDAYTKTVADSTFLKLTGGTVTGDTTFANILRTNSVLSLSGLSFWNVVNYNSTGTPTIIRINTRIPYTSGASMPTVHLSGYAYGQAAPIDLKVSWYVYNGNYTQVGATCSGAWKPTIYLTNEGGYCSINLVGSIYLPRFTIDFFDNWFGADRTDLATGWTVESITTLGTVNQILVPYRDAYLSADTTGNAATATKLQTARTIAGVSFDGTANIAIPFANLSSKPTTLAGYGITDAPTKTGTGASGT
jgi:hypothetical protein